MVWGNGQGRDVKASDLCCQDLLYFSFRLLGYRSLRSGEIKNSKDRKEKYQHTTCILVKIAVLFLHKKIVQGTLKRQFFF